MYHSRSSSSSSRRSLYPARPRSRSPSPPCDHRKSPQERLADFWTRFHSKKQGKVTSIFPRTLYASLLPGTSAKDVAADAGPSSPAPGPAAGPAGCSASAAARNAAESYEAAAEECRERVRRAVAECRRTNEKYTDPDFDIESDPLENCLYGLERGWDLFVFGDKDNRGRVQGGPGRRDGEGDPARPRRTPGGVQGKEEATPAPRSGIGCSPPEHPRSVHRVDWVFENPQFTVNGYSSSDIKQGRNGDCWWLAAVATIAHRRDLMERMCVARDEECGVYGFCFFRDGEWVPVVVDDNLYLAREDFDFYGDIYDPSGRRAQRHRQRYQTGSEALYFARCDDPDETWLPLLEKAYAKVHCDYAAIEGGWSSEGVEDMTGGVGTTIASSKILFKDKLWRELTNSEGEFVFSLSAMGTGWDRTRNGLALGHAYSILQATEARDEDGKLVRLVKIRNPWGERDNCGLGEWTGSWSDGSKEWTPYWLRKLSHTFGDDGVFWMSFADMLSTFKWIHRTRIFDSRWTVVNAWTSASVSWVTGFLRKKFRVEIKRAGMVVVVLSQLDDRYFVGLEGQYFFELHFVLQRSGAAAGENVCRVRQVHKWQNRSISCEVELEAGVYEVIPKITASREPDKRTVESMVCKYAEENPQKVRQVGVQYDLAHAKPGVPDYDMELAKEEEAEKKKREDKKNKEKARRKKDRVKQMKADELDSQRRKRTREIRRKLHARILRDAEKHAERTKKRNARRQKRRERQKERQKSDNLAGKTTEVPPATAAKTKEVSDADTPKPADPAERTTEATATAVKTEEASGVDTPGPADPPKEQPNMEEATSPGTKPAEAAKCDKPRSETWSEVSKSEAESAPLQASEAPQAPEVTSKPEPEPKSEIPTAEDSLLPLPSLSDIDTDLESEVSSDEEIRSLPDLSDIDPDTDSSSSEEDDDDDDDDDARAAEEEAAAREEEERNSPHKALPPWNPVCVIGLRVYALDPEVTVALVEVEDAEEGTALTTDGEPPGATT